MLRVLATALTLLVCAVLTGCSQGTGSRTDMTLTDAQQTTAEHMDALVARIDPELIGRIDKVTDESFGCRGNDVDPEQRVQQWENRQYVWFIEGMSPLDGRDVLDDLVTQQVADGWSVARDEPEGDGRRVLLLAPDSGQDDSELGYGVDIVDGGNIGGLASLNISAVSPCFEVAEGESWE
jgi:hypothetical protein